MKKPIVHLLVMLTATLTISCGSSSYIQSKKNMPSQVQTVAPGPGYVLVNGKWVWRNRKNEWESGGWQAERWQEGHWKKVKGKRVWVAGSWQ